MFRFRALGIGCDCCLNNNVTIRQTEIWTRLGKIYAKTIFLQYGKYVEFPKARVESRLEFLNKLSVPIHKAMGPIVEHIKRKALGSRQNVTKIGMLTTFGNNRIK